MGAYVYVHSDFDTAESSNGFGWVALSPRVPFTGMRLKRSGRLAGWLFVALTTLLSKFSERTAGEHLAGFSRYSLMGIPIVV